jgi:hypothetical protein
VQTADGKVEPRRIRTGQTDGRVTEVVEGDLNEGDVIVTGEVTDASERERTQQSGAPFGQQRYGGSGRGRSR